jgi:GST-like protein
MAGQAHHFLKFAKEDIPYAKDRYRDETARLYGVLDRQLAQNEFVAGEFISIADFSIWGWASLWEGQQQTLEDKPHMARWLETMWAREGVLRGRALMAERRPGYAEDKDLQRRLAALG